MRRTTEHTDALRQLMSSLLTPHRLLQPPKPRSAASSWCVIHCSQPGWTNHAQSHRTDPPGSQVRGNPGIGTLTA